jgi:Tfp pilus assembly protein PilF
MLVTLPFTLLLLDGWPLGRFRLRSPSWSALRPLLVEKLPLFALAAASSVVTYLAQQSSRATETLEIAPALRAGNAAVSYVAYLIDTVWPSRLAVFYPHPESSLNGAAVVASLIVLAAATWSAWRIRGGHTYVLVGWLWYVVTLLPVIGLVQVGGQARADRYTYVPLIGVFVVAVWGCADLLRAALRRVRAGTLPAPESPQRLWPVIAVLPILAVAAHVQARTWADSITLWSHAIEAVGPKVEFQIELARALMARGRVAEAITSLQEAVDRRPSSATAHHELARALILAKRPAEAIAALEETVRLDPDQVEARTRLGALLVEAGRLDEGIAQYEAALRTFPDNAETLSNLGAALVLQGELADAATRLGRAVELRPDYAHAHVNLAAAYYLAGRYHEAWSEIALARRGGLEPPPELIAGLTEKMAQP